MPLQANTMLHLACAHGRRRSKRHLRSFILLDAQRNTSAQKDARPPVGAGPNPFPEGTVGDIEQIKDFALITWIAEPASSAQVLCCENIGTALRALEWRHMLPSLRHAMDFCLDPRAIRFALTTVDPFDAGQFGFLPSIAGVQLLAVGVWIA